MIVQQKNTALRWEMPLALNGRAWAIPAGFSFKLYMTARDATTPTISAGVCTYTPLDSFVYYAPSIAAVATAGIYRAQLIADAPGDLELVLSEFEITIEANVPRGA